MRRSGPRLRSTLPPACGRVSRWRRPLPRSPQSHFGSTVALGGDEKGGARALPLMATSLREYASTVHLDRLSLRTVRLRGADVPHVGMLDPAFFTDRTASAVYAPKKIGPLYSARPLARPGVVSAFVHGLLSMSAWGTSFGILNGGCALFLPYRNSVAEKTYGGSGIRLTVGVQRRDGKARFLLARRRRFSLRPCAAPRTAPTPHAPTPNYPYLFILCSRQATRACASYGRAGSSSTTRQSTSSQSTPQVVLQSWSSQRRRKARAGAKRTRLRHPSPHARVWRAR